MIAIKISVGNQIVSTDYISLDFIRYSTSVVLWGKFWEMFFMYGLVVVDVKHRIDLYMGPSLKLTVSGFIQLPRLGSPDLPGQPTVPAIPPPLVP